MRREAIAVAVAAAAVVVYWYMKKRASGFASGRNAPDTWGPYGWHPLTGPGAGPAEWNAVRQEQADNAIKCAQRDGFAAGQRNAPDTWGPYGWHPLTGPGAGPAEWSAVAQEAADERDDHLLQ